MAPSKIMCHFAGPTIQSLLNPVLFNDKKLRQSLEFSASSVFLNIRRGCIPFIVLARDATYPLYVVSSFYLRIEC